MKISNSVILIIDPQKDFTSKKGAYAKKHSGILQIQKAKKNIQKLIDFTLLPVIIIYSNYRENQFENNLSICIPNTEGHQIDLKLKNSCYLFSKTEHDAFSSEELKKNLIEKNINSIFIGGFLAEYCVKQSAISAINFGLDVSLIEDCIGTGDDVQIRKEKLFEEMKSLGVGFVSESEFLLNK